MHRTTIIFCAALAFGAPTVATAQDDLALKPEFVIEAAKSLPSGDQTTRGGYGKNYILQQRYAPKAWVVTDGDIAVQSGALTHDIKAGTVLTEFRDASGNPVFCALPVLRVESDSFGEFDHYSSLAPAVPCLSDTDKDGRFETAVMAYRDTSRPGAYWAFSRVGPTAPVAPVGYHAGTIEQRPYGSINIFLLTLPFFSGYYLSVQDVMLGGADLTGFTPHLVPEMKDGPVSYSLGKLHVDVKSHKGGVFTYEILSGFDGEDYPDMGRTHAN